MLVSELLTRRGGDLPCPLCWVPAYCRLLASLPSRSGGILSLRRWECPWATRCDSGASHSLLLRVVKWLLPPA